jgi:hypothetical protein
MSALGGKADVNGECSAESSFELLRSGDKAVDGVRPSRGSSPKNASANQY